MKEEDFRCRCGCGLGYANMEPNFMVKLRTAEKIAKMYFNINSAIRCKKHNKNVGGKPHSAHIAGMAVDISCTNSRDRFRIVSALILAGFNRIGIATNFIHADNGEGELLDPDVIWLY